MEEEKWDNKDDAVATRMKQYESQVNLVNSNIHQDKLDPSKPWIARLDGHRFSMFTKGFIKPFDERIYNAMKKTSIDLLTEFKPSIVYTQSDEITLVFPVQYITKNINNQPSQVLAGIQLNGRILKICTLLSSYCSVRFCYHLLNEINSSNNNSNSDQNKVLIEKVFNAHFDARVFNVPNDQECLYNVIWRMKDVKRNSKNNLGLTHFTNKETHGLKPSEMVQKLRDEKQIEYNDMPGPFRLGVFIKKGLYKKECEDRKTKEKKMVERHNVLVGCVDLNYTDVSSSSSNNSNSIGGKAIEFITTKHMDSSSEYYSSFEIQKSTDDICP